eukprot:364792-Chlamydomonas_euryale.AAC.22
MPNSKHTDPPVQQEDPQVAKLNELIKTYSFKELLNPSTGKSPAGADPAWSDAELHAALTNVWNVAGASCLKETPGIISNAVNIFDTEMCGKWSEPDLDAQYHAIASAVRRLLEGLLLSWNYAQIAGLSRDGVHCMLTHIQALWATKTSDKPKDGPVGVLLNTLETMLGKWSWFGHAKVVLLVCNQQMYVGRSAIAYMSKTCSAQTKHQKHAQHTYNPIVRNF